MRNERAAKCVQPEHRLRPGQHLHAVDGGHGDEVPVDRVAEGVVDAHAVLVNGQTLRQPQQWRRGKAAKVEIGLQRIVLRVIDAHAAELPIQKVSEVQRLRALQLFGHSALHVGRNQGGVDGGAVRRYDDDFFERRRECVQVHVSSIQPRACAASRNSMIS
jgi:hypothetical protein